MTEQQTCLIVGAGISGLVAANSLQDAGWQVTVLDKGRGVGGRMATRRFDGATFDHGAQYFTVRDERFQAMVDRWLSKDIAAEWATGFPNHEGERSSGGHPRYRGADGMTRITKALAERVPVHTGTQVTQVDYTDGEWRLSAKDLNNDETQTFRAGALLMTPPAEQTLTLMRSGNVSPPDDVVSALEAITFNPCFAVLALLDKPSAVPEPGGVFMPGEPISWLADNQQKGISAQPALTIHAGPKFTRQHYDDNHDTVAQMLIEAAQDYLNGATVLEYQVQRWRYSQPANMHPDKTLYTATPGPVAFAGDAFNGARVEGAALSGMAAAERLLEQLN